MYSSVPVPTIVGSIKASHLEIQSLTSRIKELAGHVKGVGGDSLCGITILVYCSRLITDRGMNQVLLAHRFSSRPLPRLRLVVVVLTTLQELT